MPTLATIAFLAAVFSALVGSAVAQETTPAVDVTDTDVASTPADGENLPPLNCLDELATAEAVAAFQSNPQSLLNRNPTGGLILADAVRSLAGTERSTLDGLIGLVNSASPQQNAALGAGLARVALACSEGSGDYSARIQEMVALTQNQDLLTAFAAALNGLQVAAIGGGAAPALTANGGAFGTDVGGIFGAPNNFGLGGDVATPQTAGQFLSGAARSVVISPTVP